MNKTWKLVCINTGADLGAEFTCEKDAVKFRNKKMRTNPRLRFYVPKGTDVAKAV